MSDLAFKPAHALVKSIARGEVSSLEVTDHFIRRIEAHDGKINAVVVRDFDRAREQAKAADAARARGDIAGPLHGLPMTVKEAFDVQGLPTTWGFEAQRGNVARGDRSEEHTSELQ